MTKPAGEPGQGVGQPNGAGRWRDNGGGPGSDPGTGHGHRHGTTRSHVPGLTHQPGTARDHARRLGQALRPLPAMLFDAAMLLLALEYGVLQAPQLISQHELERHVTAARIVRVSALAKTSTGTACALTPYITETRAAGRDTDRINRHLRDVHYSGDDPYWALVIATPTAVHLSTIGRSSFDILGMHHLVPPQGKRATVGRIKAQFPAGFVPAECAPLQRAVLVRIALPDRNYLLMGTLPD